MPMKNGTEYMRKWRARNREKYNEYQRNYQKRNVPTNAQLREVGDYVVYLTAKLQSDAKTSDAMLSANPKFADIGKETARVLGLLKKGE